jgi:hypothetical protein
VTLDDWERSLVRLLRARDPRTELAALRAEQGPHPALDALDPDGVRVAGLLVSRLRFDRILAGDADANRWQAEDPASFARAFREYHAEVPALAFTGEDEGEAWRAWLRANPGWRPASRSGWGEE